MLIGTNFIYESLDWGDSLANLRRFVVQNFHLWAYGGRLNGEPHPDVFYLGAGNTLQHRVNLVLLC